MINNRNNFVNRNALSFLGIPIILLIITLVFFGTEKADILGDEINPYLNQLPEDYKLEVDRNQKNDSTFFCSITEKYGFRELVIFKLFPNDTEQETDFLIKLFPSDGVFFKIDKPFISFRLKTNAQLYNYKGKTYGVFKKSLPFINLKKINVQELPIFRGQIVWKNELNNPLEELKETSISLSKWKNSKEEKIPNPYISLYSNLLEADSIMYRPYALNLVKNSLFQINKDLKKHIVENDLTIGKIKNPNLFWNLFNNRAMNLTKHITFEGKNNEKAKMQINDFLKGHKSLESTFNLDKIAYFLALNNLFTKECNDFFYFSYNPTNEKFEPFFNGSNCLGEISDYIREPIIKDKGYADLYVQALKKVSEIEIYEDLIKKDSLFEQNLTLINSFYPFNIFNIDVLNINQRIIKKSLNPSTAIKPEIISVNKEKMVLSVLNMSNYPIVIKELNHQKKKSIVHLNSKGSILNGKKDTLEIPLPRSFENLFVSKKKRATGFLLYKHIYELFIGYSVEGLDDTYFSAIIPYQPKDDIVDDLMRIKSNCNNRDDIFINNESKIISFSNQEITISSPLIIPKGYTLVLKPGTDIDIIKGGKIISYSPLNFKGTKNKPITFFSSDKKGQGIIVLSDGEQSNLDHVIFNNLTNLKHGYWNVTGAVMFYESPVNLNYVTISNNTCEDALNIIRSDFNMMNCIISHTQSDAFDGDFVTGTISASKFENLGNDAIDVSGSNLIIKNVSIRNAGDKGISAGENSRMQINNVDISDSEIAIAGKDLSIVDAINLKITNTKLGFTAFQKKPEFGPSNITVSGVTMNNIETKYLIESSSSLFIDDKKIETTQNVKGRMYGVEFGVSSEETRNSQ